jgi:hypothetical protein
MNADVAPDQVDRIEANQRLCVLPAACLADTLKQL